MCLHSVFTSQHQKCLFCAARRSQELKMLAQASSHSIRRLIVKHPSTTISIYLSSIRVTAKRVALALHSARGLHSGRQPNYPASRAQGLWSGHSTPYKASGNSLFMGSPGLLDQACPSQILHPAPNREYAFILPVFFSPSHLPKYLA